MLRINVRTNADNAKDYFDRGLSQEDYYLDEAEITGTWHGRIAKQWKLTGEISGYYAGPGVWGGVFEYESSWSLNVGLQRKFLKDRLNIKISGSDLFFESGWDGISEFNGLTSEGSGRWDSRRTTISASYRFGNDKVKSRKRKTGLEEEGKRVGK